MEQAARDPLATDTADPGRVFRLMLPSPAPRLDWRLFCAPEDFLKRYGARGGALKGTRR